MMKRPTLFAIACDSNVVNVVRHDGIMRLLV